MRDVAWAPSIGIGRAYLASAGQDKVVKIWTQDSPTSEWQCAALEPEPGKPYFGDVVWRVSWSISGNVLAVSSGAWLLSRFSRLFTDGLMQAMARSACGRRTSRVSLRRCLRSPTSLQQLGV